MTVEKVRRKPSLPETRVNRLLGFFSVICLTVFLVRAGPRPILYLTFSYLWEEKRGGSFGPVDDGPVLVTRTSEDDLTVVNLLKRTRGTVSLLNKVGE